MSRTGSALSLAKRRVLDTRYGWRPERKTLILVVTNGKSVDNPSRAIADLLAIPGLSTIVLGLEPNEARNAAGRSFRNRRFDTEPALDGDQLLELAGGDKNRVFVACEGQTDADLKAALTHAICLRSAPPSLTSPNA